MLIYSGRTRFISRSIHTTSHPSMPLVMEMMAVIVTALTNQCVRMELTATGQVEIILCNKLGVFMEASVGCILRENYMIPLRPVAGVLSQSLASLPGVGMQNKISRYEAMPIICQNRN